MPRREEGVVSKVRGAGFRIIIVLVVLLGAWSVASLVSGYTLPLVFDRWNEAGVTIVEPKVGASVAPLAAFDLDDGDWSAYIVLDQYDFGELKGQLPRNCLKMNDREELKRLQRGLTGTYTGGDMATVTSSLVFVRNGRIAFATGLVLRGKDLVGLQSPKWGFLEPEREDVRIGFASRFSPIYWPVLVLW
jgi:hypothetical protein